MTKPFSFLAFRNTVSHGNYPIDSRGLEGPFNTDNLALTSTPKNKGVARTVANVPPVFSGMDKAEALAYVSRLFDAAQAGAVLWGDKLLLKRIP